MRPQPPAGAEHSPRPSCARALSHSRSRGFLEAFNKCAFPLFVTVFADVERRQDVKGVLEQLQKATRTLQAHCAQSKAIGATGALSQEPHVKKQLELLVFNVKRMLAENNCAAAFWVGNLKHKSAAGVVLPSQVVREAEAKAKAKAKAKAGSKRKRRGSGGDGAEDGLSDEAVEEIDDLSVARAIDTGSADDADGEYGEDDGDDDEELGDGDSAEDDEEASAVLDEDEDDDDEDDD